MYVAWGDLLCSYVFLLSVPMIKWPAMRRDVQTVFNIETLLKACNEAISHKVLKRDACSSSGSLREQSVCRIGIFYHNTAWIL